MRFRFILHIILEKQSAVCLCSAYGIKCSMALALALAMECIQWSAKHKFSIASFFIWSNLGSSTRFHTFISSFGALVFYVNSFLSYVLHVDGVSDTRKIYWLPYLANGKTNRAIVDIGHFHFYPCDVLQLVAGHTLYFAKANYILINQPKMHEFRS